MSIPQLLKKFLTSHVLKIKRHLVKLNSTINAKNQIKQIVRRSNAPKLSVEEKQAALNYYKKRGYKLNNTLWHRYLKAVNGEFHENYIPQDIYRPLIDPKMNQMKQWPALLDKNLTYNLFSEFKQPEPLVHNINGFYFVKGEIVNQIRAIEECINHRDSFIIKPTIDTGKGKMVQKYSVDESNKPGQSLKLKNLFDFYKKDFIIQAVVEQSEAMKALNPSSLNTLRIISYLRADGVHILSSILRIGNPDSNTDNYSLGGIICGIEDSGHLKNKGYNMFGETFLTTPSGITLNGFRIPNYNKVKEMVTALHVKVPYFRLISWDIGININDMPIFIEYNTYYQSFEVHQITNGPLFGKFTDEILARGLEAY